jgi:hypothetical protein
MHRLAGGHGQVHGIGQGLVGEEGAGADGAVDARVFLVHHPAGAEIQVPDLGVAHLVRGQADRRLGGVDQGVRIVLPEIVPSGLSGLGDGVVFGIFPVTPAVHHDNINGFGVAGMILYAGLY